MLDLVGPSFMSGSKSNQIGPNPTGSGTTNLAISGDSLELQTGPNINLGIH
jgi:hypothetical protein